MIANSVILFNGNMRDRPLLKALLSLETFDLSKATKIRVRLGTIDILRHLMLLRIVFHIYLREFQVIIQYKSLHLSQFLLPNFHLTLGEWFRLRLGTQRMNHRRLRTTLFLKSYNLLGCCHLICVTDSTNGLGFLLHARSTFERRMNFPGMIHIAEQH